MYLFYKCSKMTLSNKTWYSYVALMRLRQKERLARLSYEVHVRVAWYSA